MEIKNCVKESFCVIGKLGSTNDGVGFINKLWKDANEHFAEIEHLAKKDKYGKFVGFWGAMSDFSLSFKPWEENYTKGLYLAGVEVDNDAIPPKNWDKWVLPAYEYLCFKCDEECNWETVINYFKENKIQLAGAAYDYNCPNENGQGYIYVPIKKL